LTTSLFVFYKFIYFQDFLSVNVPEFWSKDIWSPSSPDANPLEYYVWIVCERGVNKQHHSNIEAVKVTIRKKMMMSLNKEHLIWHAHSSEVVSRKLLKEMEIFLNNLLKNNFVHDFIFIQINISSKFMIF